MLRCSASVCVSSGSFSGESDDQPFLGISNTKAVKMMRARLHPRCISWSISSFIKEKNEISTLTKVLITVNFNTLYTHLSLALRKRLKERNYSPNAVHGKLYVLHKYLLPFFKTSNQN